ncbi:hypothetical protein [Umezawaea sp.]|uniref:hypothetical protein n=1 Tax=Umezawaea sp. TaxID=1955258 RepID=UPI002ED0E13E
MSIEIERKFLLHPVHDRSTLPSDSRTVDLEQIYLLVSEVEEKRIRRTSGAGVTTYAFAHLVPLGRGVRRVDEHVIDDVEYRRLSRLSDTSRHPVRKTRTCFSWGDLVVELDHIARPATRECWVAEVQVDHEEREVVLPDFLRVDREVTGEPAYSNANIALG